MNVILLDNVENLGSIGDLVKVKPGYGRNYLIPQGKAALATPENMKQMEARRAELEKVAAEELAAAKKRFEAINGTEVVISANAGSEDKLFGSVGPIDIVEALAGVQVEADPIVPEDKLDGRVRARQGKRDPRRVGVLDGIVQGLTNDIVKIPLQILFG